MPPCGGAAGPSNVRQNAKIVIGATLMHCVIRDLSHSGAGIVVENPKLCPRTFTFTMWRIDCECVLHNCVGIRTEVLECHFARMAFSAISQC